MGQSEETQSVQSGLGDTRGPMPGSLPEERLGEGSRREMKGVGREKQVETSLIWEHVEK